MTPLEHALAYAAAGLPVFPCDANKRPLTEHGFKDATTDATLIRFWWGQRPDALIGMPTGDASGVYVVDADIDKETGEAVGEATLHALADIPPNAPIVISQSGGLHVWMRHMPGLANSSKKLGPCLDTRGEGGYVCVPGAGGYRWHGLGVLDVGKDALPEPPEPLRRYRAADAPPKVSGRHAPAKMFATADPEPIHDDARDDLAFFQDALAAAPNTLDRDGYIRLCYAIKAGLGENARAAWVAWAYRWSGQHEQTPEYTWDTAKPDGAVGLGSALHWLRASGLSPEAERDLRTRHVRAYARASTRAAEFRVEDFERGAPAATGGAAAEPEFGDAEDHDAAPFDFWARVEPPAISRGVLPSVVEAFATEKARLMGVDPTGLAMSALTVCAAALPDGIKVKVKVHDPSWRESARLWVALVGPPSAKKSPTISEAAYPLKEIDRDLVRRYMAAKAEYEALPKDEKKDAEPPKQTRVRIEDTTIEAAQQVLADSPDGVLLYQDELSGWFGSMEKYASGKGGAKDRGFWLQAWNGGDYAVNRVGRGVALIPNLSVSMIGGIQPDPIRRTAADTVDDGLLQRFFMVILKEPRVGVDEDGDQHVIERYRHAVKRLHSRRPSDEGPHVFSPEAQAVRRALEERHHALMRLETLHPKLAAHVGKYDGLFARLCLLFHHLDHHEAATVPRAIPAGVAKRVAALLHDVLLRHAVAFWFDVVGAGEDHDAVVAVASFILRKRLDMVTHRDVQRSGPTAARGLTYGDAARVFETLHAFGWLLPAPLAPGERAARWIVNPAVHDLLATRREAEERRVSQARNAMRAVFGQEAGHEQDE